MKMKNKQKNDASVYVIGIPGVQSSLRPQHEGHQPQRTSGPM